MHKILTSWKLIPRSLNGIGVRRDLGEPSPAAFASAALLVPVTLPQAVEEDVREAYIEILNRHNRSLVTILEVLSPTGPDVMLDQQSFFSLTYQRVR